MRDFHQLPPDGPHGEPAGGMEGDGGGVMLTISPGGAVMCPVQPAYSRDEYGATKHEYKALRARGQGTLYAAGSP